MRIFFMPFLLLIHFSELCYDHPSAVSYKSITDNSSTNVLIQCLIPEEINCQFETLGCCIKQK
jgi:hypothetical protein